MEGTEHQNPTTPTTRFVGLQWKIAIILSITLMLINLAIVVITEKRTTRNFSQVNLQQSEYHFRNWYGLLDDGNQTLVQLAAFVPLLDTREKNAPPGSPEQISRIIEEHSALLDLEWGVQSITFFDADGKAISAWPAPQISVNAMNAVDRAVETEEPTSWLDCSPACVQYLAVPQLHHGRSVGGTLLLGRSLADAIISFSNVSGSELVILKPSAAGSTSQVRVDRYLPQWQQAIPAVSNPVTTLPLLKALAETQTLQTLQGSDLLFQFQWQWYHVALSKDPQNDSTYLLLSDVTDQVRQLNTTRLIIILTGLAGFLLTTLLLIWFLRAPLTRLQDLVAMLPFIGAHEHNEARKRLPMSRQSMSGDDEIDVLVRAVGDLNEQLEQADLARAEAEERLIWLADHDPLTGLYNRRRFQQDFEFILKQAQRHHHTGALLYFDLDDFKAVNDLSGHQAGDELLKLVGTALRKVIRSTDLFARLGGDEFAVVLPQTTPEHATILADKLLRTLQKLEFPAGGTVHRVSGSIGIALFPQHGENVKDLLANADITMYQAKKMGHGRWHMFSDSDAFREMLTARTLWRDKITHALEHDGFVLHFQPILDIPSNKIVRHEVLIRMIDSDDSLIYPDRFIPVAEQTGQIHEIDRWVISKAIAMMRVTPGLSLSVNLSGSVVDDPGLFGWIKPQLQDDAIDPTRVIFELTETAAVESLDAAIELMNEMRGLGCQFALDDFGSGFASYNYLKRLPVDLIKIDGAFIRHLNDNPDDQLFVKALSDVAHGLGKLTVAEFVEDESTLTLLRQYGVRYAQGYYIGKPAPTIETEARAATQ